MHDYPCKNDTKRAVSPVKDECPGEVSPGKNRDIFMGAIATFHGKELSLKITCPMNTNSEHSSQEITLLKLYRCCH